MSRLLIALFFSLVLVPNSNGWTGEINGKVIEVAPPPPPPTSIAGVTVQYRDPHDGTDHETLTTSNGDFQCGDLKPGKYELIFEKIGYYAQKVTVEVKGGNNASVQAEVQLFRDEGEDYWVEVGSAFAASAADKPPEAMLQQYSQSWAQLEQLPVPARFKYAAAKSMNEADPAASRYVPAVAAYVATEMQTILRAEATFQRAFLGEQRLPSRKDLSIDPIIARDIVWFDVNNAATSDDHKSNVAREFEAVWDTELPSAIPFRGNEDGRSQFLAE